MSSASRAAGLAAALLALSACGGSGSGAAAAPSTGSPASSGGAGPNVMTVSVDGSLCAANAYVNEPCVAVTVCTPDQVSCQTVSGLLLDTGSYGLRIFKQALSIPLPTVVAGAGTLATCARFGDGTSDWGPVARAAVILAGEPAVTVPVQVIDSTFATPPGTCPSPDTGPAAAGFNGILGIGPFAADCGTGCTVSASNGVYFTCSGTTCSGFAPPESNQLLNPAAALGTDGAGILVHLPAVAAGGAPSATGEVRLGIGSRSNNVPGAVTPLALDVVGEFRATLLGQGWSAFVDTGSNGFFFTPPSGVTTLPACPSPLQAWFCPTSTVAISGTASPSSGSGSAAVAFDVANLQSLLAGSPSASVFGTIGGSGMGPSLADFGLPFHLGRDVWIGFEGKTSTLGTGPLVAF